MMTRTKQYHRVYGVRFSPADSRKLEQLCAHTHRPASEVLRLLVRLAEPVDLPSVRFAEPEVAVCDGEE
jgi:hypothetical protein